MAKQNTRQKIIHTAEALLWQNGYDGASLNDVVAKAGVSKGALFHYYPNKRAVTLEVLQKYTNEQIFTPLDKHLSSAKTPGALKIALLEWLQKSFGAYAQKGFKGGCMLGNFALEISDQDEDMREEMKKIFLKWENELVSHLRPAAAAGKVLMEPRQLARLIIAIYQGITMTAKVHKDQNRASRDFQALAELIERTIID